MGSGQIRRMQTQPLKLQKAQIQVEKSLCSTAELFWHVGKLPRRHESQHTSAST